MKDQHLKPLIDRLRENCAAALLLGALAASAALDAAPAGAADAPSARAGASGENQLMAPMPGAPGEGAHGEVTAQPQAEAASAPAAPAGEAPEEPEASEGPEGREEEGGEPPSGETPAGPAGAAPLSREAAGRAKYRLDARSYFDRFAHNGAWIQAHVDVIKAYPRFGDVYVRYGKPVLGAHDPATEGYAPLNDAQIEAFVAKVKRDVAAGYAGVFVDDANWSFNPSPGPESHLTKLLQAIRRAVPGALIEMNSQYHDIWPKIKAGDPNVARALAQVNLVTKEFGVGANAGINTAQDYTEFLTYADTLRGKGIHVVMTGEDPDRVPVEEYDLATCLLINDGGDFINASKGRPGHFWRGFRVNVGAALGPRERLRAGLWRRRFSGGVVYTVEPGGATQTVRLGKKMHSAEWGTIESVTLAPEQGAVLAG